MSDYGSQNLRNSSKEKSPVNVPQILFLDLGIFRVKNDLSDSLLVDFATLFLCLKNAEISEDFKDVFLVFFDFKNLVYDLVHVEREAFEVLLFDVLDKGRLSAAHRAGYSDKVYRVEIKDGIYLEKQLDSQKEIAKPGFFEGLVRETE